MLYSKIWRHIQAIAKKILGLKQQCYERYTVESSDKSAIMEMQVITICISLYLESQDRAAIVGMSHSEETIADCFLSKSSII